MELGDLPELAASSGATLNVEERAGLRVAMRKRALDEKLQRVLFWGKVTGGDRDYLVAYGFPASADYPRKRWFFCTTGDMTLQALPELSEEFAALAAALAGPFRGDPTALLDGGEEEEEEDEEEFDEDGEPLPKAPKKVRFSEMHRLAFVVQAIEQDTAVVPRGAYVVSPTHYVVRNASFSGLDEVAADSLGSFFHFRAATGLARKSALEKRGLVASTDFLDPLSEDGPAGVWSKRLDLALGQVTLRSLKWPGYHFFAAVGAAKFGGAYFGDGAVNADLAFSV